MSKIIILKKGITDFDTECIVNAANTNLRNGTGVCGAIFKAAGAYELQKSCDKIGYCNTGDAVITPAFNLKNIKYIIHAVGPYYSYSNLKICREQLYNAYKKSLELMLENGCHSIAFPLISSGVYKYPAEEAWRIALKACRTFINQHKNDNISIYFAMVNDEKYELGEKLLKEILKEDYDGGTLRLYEALGYLHRQGYQKLRLTTRFNETGTRLTTEISIKENFDIETGFTLINYNFNNEPVYSYSSYSGYCFFDAEQSDELLSIEELAQKILNIYPKLEKMGKGDDLEYAEWFNRLLKIARNGILPFAYLDGDYDIFKAGYIKLTNGEFFEYAPPGECDFMTARAFDLDNSPCFRYDEIKEISLVTYCNYNNEVNYNDLLRISRNWISYKRVHNNTKKELLSYSYKTSSYKLIEGFEKICSRLEDIHRHYNGDIDKPESGYFNFRVTLKNNKYYDYSFAGDFASNNLSELGVRILNIIPEGEEYSHLLNLFKDKPLNRSNFEKIEKENLCALMFAEGGAMGSPGHIEVIDGDFNRYFTNCLFDDSDVDQFEVFKLFDGIENMNLYTHYLTLFMNKCNWEYINLGAGNHLYLREDLFRKIGKLIVDNVMVNSYCKWIKLTREKD